MFCFALQGAVVVRTISSTCLAAGPGPGGVSPTLRGKGLGAQGIWWAKAFPAFLLHPTGQLGHLPLATFHSRGGGSPEKQAKWVAEGCWNFVCGHLFLSGCALFQWRYYFCPREFRVLPGEKSNALILAQLFVKP